MPMDQIAEALHSGLEIFTWEEECSVRLPAKFAWVQQSSVSAKGGRWGSHSAMNYDKVDASN